MKKRGAFPLFFYLPKSEVCNKKFTAFALLISRGNGILLLEECFNLEGCAAQCQSFL